MAERKWPASCWSSSLTTATECHPISVGMHLVSTALLLSMAARIPLLVHAAAHEQLGAVALLLDCLTPEQMLLANKGKNALHIAVRDDCKELKLLLIERMPLAAFRMQDFRYGHYPLLDFLAHMGEDVEEDPLRAMLARLEERDLTAMRVDGGTHGCQPAGWQQECRR